MSKVNIAQLCTVVNSDGSFTMAGMVPSGNFMGDPSSMAGTTLGFFTIFFLRYMLGNFFL